MSRAASARGARAPREPVLRRALDFGSDWALAAYAVWTLIAYGGMVARAHVGVLVAVWIVTIPLLAAGLFFLQRRAEPGIARSDEPVGPPPAKEGRRETLLLVGGLAAGLGAAVLGAWAGQVPWVVSWLAALVAVAVTAVGALRRSSWRDAVRPAGAFPVDVFVMLAGAGFAALSLFSSRTDGDDVFYVNRATATDQLDRIPIRDVLITNEQAAPTSGAGLPVDTFSALQGALAHLFDVHAASVAYYVTPPLFTFLATWALWRLLRAWAPRAALLCFALGCVYWLFSADLRLMPGSFFLTRMWQGKVIFVAWLVPTLYVLLTRWLDRRDPRVAVLLLAGGVSSIGMTGSASFVAPLIFATAGVALAARRDWAGLPVLAGAALFPFVVGFAASQKYPLDQALTTGKHGSSFIYEEMIGVGVLAVIGGTALWWAPWLVQSAPAAWLTVGIGVVALIVLAPGVTDLISEVAGLTRTLRRMLWLVPLPALVGLLALLPLPRLPPAARLALPSVLVAVLLIAFGEPLWGPNGKDFLGSKPRWKNDAQPLADARAILARYNGEGPILAEQQIMRAISLLTVAPKAVSPRAYYVKLIPERRGRTAARLRLTRAVMQEPPRPTPGQIRRALADLRVGLVCLRESQRDLMTEIKDAGPYFEAFRIRRQVCFERLPNSENAATPAGLQARRPNVLLVATDDQRWDTLRYMPTVRNELAAKGTTFENAFVVNPVCCPSRATLLTGTYSHTNGVWGNKGPHGGFRHFDDDSTLPVWLDQAGYETLMAGKYLNGYHPRLAVPTYVPPGWDRWFAYWGQHPNAYFGYEVTDGASVRSFGSEAIDYATDVLAAEAVRFIRTSGPEPFFLYFAPKAPHISPSNFRVEPAPRHVDRFKGLEPWAPPSLNERDVEDKPLYVRSSPVVDEEQLAKLRRQQLQSLLAVDDALAAMLAVLEETGKLADTLILYTSDNGYFWGEHREFQKNAPYEEAIRVPFVVRYDQLGTPPRVVRRPVLNLDIAPTIAAAAEVSVRTEGRSLLPLLRGRTPEWRSGFLFEQYMGRGWRVPGYCAFRGGRWKYVQYETGEEELYDLRADPYELRSLHGDRPRLINAFRKYVVRSACRPPGFRPLKAGSIGRP